ncbi:lymphocyte antigen 6K, partial [Equus przewalskii]|uniref:Lymphocyte antigen 6K n=1 Tax=Equus przewalskii TaxID=9798 RepID=A0ABM4QCX6_EQUPR
SGTQKVPEGSGRFLQTRGRHGRFHKVRAPHGRACAALRLEPQSRSAAAGHGGDRPGCPGRLRSQWCRPDVLTWVQADDIVPCPSRALPRAQLLAPGRLGSSASAPLVLTLISRAVTGPELPRGGGQPRAGPRGRGRPSSLALGRGRVRPSAASESGGRCRPRGCCVVQCVCRVQPSRDRCGPKDPPFSPLPLGGCSRVHTGVRGCTVAPRERLPGRLLLRTRCAELCGGQAPLEMTLLLALLLAMGLPQVETNVTGSGKQDVLRCHVCERENNFNCAGPTNCSDRETYCSFAVVRIFPRFFYVSKQCAEYCSIKPPYLEKSFVIIKPMPFLYVMCCQTSLCNDAEPDIRDEEDNTKKKPKKASAVRSSRAGLLVFLTLASAFLGLRLP